MSDINGGDIIGKMTMFGNDRLNISSGAASTARRICDLLAMGGYKQGDERKVAKKALEFFIFGAVQMNAFIESLEVLDDKA